MSDIVTRLLLKTNEFDANLNNAKQSVNGFQSGISSAAQTAGAGIAKFAGAIGLAVGATEAFNKTIGSTQTTGDAFAKKMDQAKGSVDAFFTSIAMGDFSGFLSNLGNVIGKSGELSALMDELATKSLFADAELNGLLTQKRLQENIAKDKTKSDAERNKALEKARSLQIEINKLQSGLANTNRTTAYATLDAGIAKQGLKGNVARETWDFALKESNRQKVTDYANLYRGKVSQIDNAKEINMNTGMLMETPESKRLQANFNKWVNGSNGQFAKFAYYFSEMDDSMGSDMEKAISLISKADSMKGAISDAELVLNNTDAKINGSYKSNNKNSSNTGGEKKEAPLAGSIAYFDAMIAESNAKLIKSTDAQARATIQATISELEKQKIEVLIADKGDSIEAISMKIAALKSEFASATTDEAREDIQKLINELDRKMSYMTGKAKAPLKKAGLPTEGYDTKKINPFKSPVKKKDIKLNEDFNESLSAMGDIMGSLSGAFDQNTASALQWGATLLTTIGQTVSAIQSAIPAKKASAAASKEEATAEMVDGAAKTVNAHASIPFAGIAIGLAGVASIIAVLSNMPKFATGGIVGGSSFAGDNVLARVNSGEMILNAGQQSNLFRMLNAGLYAGITAEQVQPNIGNVTRFIMPDESAREIVISGTLRANGSVLETVLNNYTHKKSKIR